MLNTKNNYDVMGAFGNVTIKEYNNNVLVQDKTIHNNITLEGITNILDCMCLSRSPVITGIRIMYIEGSEAKVKDFTEFSSRKVRQGNVPYLELKFYLSSDELNGTTLTGAKLLTQDGASNTIIFAEVDITSKFADTTENVIETIHKTVEKSVIYIWRIGITSEFLKSIS